MTEMTKIDDLGAAADWVTSRIRHGLTLSRALLQTWDFSKGSVWTTVNSSVGLHASLDFAQGGKLAEVRERGLDEPEDILGRFISRRLASEDAALVVEDELRRKGDPAVDDQPGRTGFLDKQVYVFLPSEDASLQTIQEILLKTFAPFLNVMVLASADLAPEVPENGAELEAAMLERAAESATTLIVGAYDEEAHIVWMKN